MVIGLPVPPAPAWAGQLATTRLSISTPHRLGWFRRWNAADPTKPDGKEKPYRDRVKPFRFLQHAPLDATLGQPAGMSAGAKLNLVAPYGERRRWVNLHDPAGLTHRVVAYQPTSGDTSVVVARTYGGLVAAHPFHPEPKSLGPDGLPCHERTVGLLPTANRGRRVGTAMDKRTRRAL